MSQASVFSAAVRDGRLGLLLGRVGPEPLGPGAPLALLHGLVVEAVVPLLVVTHGAIFPRSRLLHHAHPDSRPALAAVRQVPPTIARPEYVGQPRPARYTGPEVKDADTIARMRVAGRIAAQALAEVGRHVAPGVTTDELDRVGHEFLVDHGAYPSTLGYKGFPKSLCTSVNEVVCHGIPDSTELRDGDIVNVDITAYIGGVHGDTDATFLVGDVAEEDRLLVERTEEALRRAIKAVRPGRPISVIGRVIESYARRFGYGVVRDFTGHGIGHVVPLRAGRAALRRPVARHRDRGGHDVHDRADAQPRHARVGDVGRRLDRGDPRPARGRRSSSTRSW